MRIGNGCTGAIIKMKEIKELLNGEIAVQSDEYIKDGVLYCKKCKTPRLFVYGDFTARCLCNCQKEAFEKKEREEKAKKRLEYVKALQKASLIGERYKKVTFSETETGHNSDFDAAFIRCKRYCEVADIVLKDGLGIYIYGQSGTGKTHLTACMANDLMSRLKQVLFTNFSEISKILSEDKQNENKLATIDFLFIDDIGTERVQTKNGDLQMQEKIYDIVNKRYNNKKPIIFTSNYPIADLATERGIAAKTVDRISEMASAVLKINGVNYRLKEQKTKLPF